MGAENAFQLGLLQRQLSDKQFPVHHQTAAKYLPALMEKFRTSSGPLNGPMALINSISYTPYFIRFCRLDASKGLAVIQTKRVAAAIDEILTMTPNDAGSIGQFLATILLLQGTGDVDPKDSKILLPKLKLWQRRFSGRLAEDTAFRVEMLLMSRGKTPEMMLPVLAMLASKLDKCSHPSCDRKERVGGGELMRCAKCKSASYCGSEHQKKHWPQHKALCFAATF
ncbi:hypothetical protein BDQ12DRAFT_642268 [Crucibulum laeve]|uniref:MYND-type domain-containing protein n=1 Tax=Crucibulum laeve TaxID=68775 RepID=A0A5C3MMB1_9AGAR|nr:hypothetical protein BDQ12DRAFT_642268 [Crucibulum laeve]